MGLLSRLAGRPSDSDVALIAAVRAGDPEGVERALMGADGGKPARVEAVNKDTGRTVLMEAAVSTQGSVGQVLAKLKRYKANFERQEKVPVQFGDKVEKVKVTALELAALHGRRDVFLFLVKYGYCHADPASMSRLLPNLQRKLEALRTANGSKTLLTESGSEDDFAALINDVKMLLPDSAANVSVPISPPKAFKSTEKLSRGMPNVVSVPNMGGKLVNAVINLLVTVRSDRINKHRMRQQLWGSLAALGPDEAYILLQICEAIDEHDKVFRKAVSAGLQSMNVARIMTQTITEVEYLWHSYQNFEGQWFKELLGGFGAGENDLTLTPHVRNTVIATVLGSGSAISRWFSGGREDLLTDGKTTGVANLQANGNFENAALSVIGAQSGRKVIGEMRQHLRLPTDELVIRAFNTSPEETMRNNGQEHVLAVAVRHWTDMLALGNFSHQRQEQLDPINAIRILMPAVVTYRANFRGLSNWDSRQLGELLGACQALEGSNLDTARQLLRRLKEAARGLAGGTPLFFNLYTQWCDPGNHKVSNRSSAAAMLVCPSLTVHGDCVWGC